MAKKPSFTARYKDFCLKYRHNLERFTFDVFGVTPTWQQVDFMRAVQIPGSRVAVSSGHGTGKTFIDAATSYWHLTVYSQNTKVL